jgi:hypothetical protein
MGIAFSFIIEVAVLDRCSDIVVSEREQPVAVDQRLLCG